MFRTSGDTSKKNSYSSQNSFLRGNWPNNDIIRPTSPAASPLKWGKMQLYKVHILQLWNRFNFLARFRAPRSVDSRVVEENDPSYGDLFFYVLQPRANKKNIIIKKTLPPSRSSAKRHEKELALKSPNPRV